MSIIILLVFILDYFQEKLISSVSKSKKKPILGAILELFAQISSIMNSPGKTGSVSF